MSEFRHHRSPNQFRFHQNFACFDYTTICGESSNKKMPVCLFKSFVSTKYFSDWKTIRTPRPPHLHPSNCHLEATNRHLHLPRYFLFIANKTQNEKSKQRGDFLWPASSKKLIAENTESRDDAASAGCFWCTVITSSGTWMLLAFLRDVGLP